MLKYFCFALFLTIEVSIHVNFRIQHWASAKMTEASIPSGPKYIRGESGMVGLSQHGGFLTVREP